MELLRYVLLANGLLGVVSIAYFVLLRRETFFGANRIALWLGLAAALILPLLEVPDWRPRPVRKVMQRTAQVIVPKVFPNSHIRPPEVTITFPNGQTYQMDTQAALLAQQSQSVRFWQTSLIALYILGALFFLIRFGLRLASLVRVINRSAHDPYDGFTLVLHENTSSPFSFFRWVVLTPAHHSSDELDQILRHERVHVRSWHSLDMIGAELICIVFWFNPAAYLFRHLLHQTLEFGADQAVLAEGVDVRAYQYNLVKVGLSAGRSVFTNQFSGPTLRQRIAMINRERSYPVNFWGRYMIWGALLASMALACRHIQPEDDSLSTKPRAPFPLTNATRIAAAELHKPDMPWFRQSSLLADEVSKPLNRRPRLSRLLINYPEALCLRNNHLALKTQNGEQVKVFINGQEASAQSLSALTFDEVNDLLIYRKWDDVQGVNKFPETYRIFISTTHKTIANDPIREKWKQFLEAAAVSDNPLGVSNTFSMNKLLEATFFSNKLAFVKRTKDDHLTLYDEYKTDIEAYINGISVRPKEIESVHVREVDRLYARERSFEEWTDGPNRQARFILYIQTTPKRARRDSSYYVFSPFYTGDF
ncbi:M56 family metallopeptidase [Spirosoma endbachense]|uniref:Peptidase M56 domain-containing protein n=1 Tax=Spirosoma endbachense TaxID=2666025 RepID=A0A6P1W1B5_9BACT|nr:M56 family metallopeptidase [Spirosoma endbachense]QHV98102.1 hypothetical protein GJR95_25215 [Spirosoma endbachense]